MVGNRLAAVKANFQETENQAEVLLSGRNLPQEAVIARLAINQPGKNQVQNHSETNRLSNAAAMMVMIAASKLLLC